MSFTVPSRMCHFHLKGLRLLNNYLISCQCTKIKPQTSSLNCKYRFWYWIYLTTLFCLVGFVFDIITADTKVPSSHAECLGGWATICYISVTDLGGKKKSLFSVNPRKAFFVSILYIILYHYFFHCSGKSCQFCLQNSSRLFTCFTTTLLPPFPPTVFYHQNKKKDPIIT